MVLVEKRMFLVESQHPTANGLARHSILTASGAFWGAPVTDHCISPLNLRAGIDSSRMFYQG